MQYYDQHLHTYFSPDSKETFERYLSQSNLPVVTTEHIDFFSPHQSNDDVIPDYDGYAQVIEALNKMMTVEFKEKLNNIDNPYGDGHSSERIVKILKEKLYV